MKNILKLFLGLTTCRIGDIISLIKEVKHIKTIKEIRTELGMTRAEFSEKFHIPLRNVGHWELDRNPPSYLIPLLLDLIAYQEKARKYAVAYNVLLESVGALPEE